MANANTIIGSSIVIDGEITGEEDLVIQGTVKGKVVLKESLYVEGSGVVAEGSLRPDGTFAATNLSRASEISFQRASSE